MHLVLIVAMLSTIGCDRVTKHIAAGTFAGASGRSLLADTIRLSYAENTGGFLSLGADLPPVVRTGVFTVGTGLVLLTLMIAAVRFRWHAWSLVGLTLFVSGGASNWIDRVIHGRVVDFLNVGVGPLRTGVFNVADVAIMAGAGLIVLGELRRGESRSAKCETDEASQLACGTAGVETVPTPQRTTTTTATIERKPS